MALPSSPNSISMNQVNVELGYSGTAQISLNDAAVRTLFEKTTAGSAISMNDGRGKSSVAQPQITGDLGSWDSAGALTSSSLSSNRTINYYKYFYMPNYYTNGYNSAYGGNSIGFTVTGASLTYEWQYLSYYGILNTTNCTPAAYSAITMVGDASYNDAISGGNTNTISFTSVYGYYSRGYPYGNYRGVDGYWRLKASNSAGTIYSPWIEVHKYWDQYTYDCNCYCPCSTSYQCVCGCDENNENCNECCGYYCDCNESCDTCTGYYENAIGYYNNWCA